MTTQITPKLLLESLAALPQHLHDYLSSPEFTETVYTIGNGHSLHVDKIGKLIEETTYVFCGLRDKATFSQNLVSALGIDATTADKIVTEINEKITAGIKQALYTSEEEKRREEEEEKKWAAEEASAVAATKPKEVPLEKGALLREIENPQKTPLSGRMTVEKVAVPVLNVIEPKPVANRIPITQPASEQPQQAAPLDIKKARETGTVVAQKEIKQVDPYREAV